MGKKLLIAIVAACALGISSATPTATNGPLVEVVKKSKKPGGCTKRTCRQMKSCAEAKYHFKQCGIKKLDRDRDGVPCENLCPGG